MEPAWSDAHMLQALYKVTGYSDFRPKQREAIEAVLQGRDVVLVLATGGGKSACFQVPALVKSQAVLVVSPTISLMKDQVSSLQQRGLAACLLGSASSEQERSGAYAGSYQYVYVTPEYLVSRSMEQLQALHSSCKFCCLAVDEAHCISQWGKGYRDSFLALSRMRAAESPLRDLPWIAVTATATTAVQMEIAATLMLRSPLVICGSVERPNLHISVLRKPSEDIAMAVSMLTGLILGEPSRLQEQPQHQSRVDCCVSARITPTIIYCVSRSQVDQFCNLMNTNERLRGKVAKYSAGLSQEERARTGQQFAEGTVPVVIATTAFGLGVNKKDVRLVINWGLPGSLDMFMQMIGRAGRDLRPARCMLFWSPAGVSTRKFMLRQDATSGKGTAADSSDFDAMVNFVKMPVGCRHAFLSQRFSSNAQNAPGVHTLCHGGCDVCDLRGAAVRDLAGSFCRNILLQSRGAGLPEPELLRRCMATPRNQVGAGRSYGQGSKAVWLELAHEMLSMGLLQDMAAATEGAEPEATARIHRITQAGEQELQRIQSVVRARLESSAEGAPHAAPVGPLTSRMRLSRLAMQALTLSCAVASQRITQQMAMGRKNLEDLCDGINCSAQLPEAFRALLPCVAWEASICDICHHSLREHKVDATLWTCLKQHIIVLARGASESSYCDVKQRDAFTACKREWCRRANVVSAEERMNSALAEGLVQAVAVKKQQSKAKVSLALKKLGRKLEALQRAQGNGGAASCTVFTQAQCDQIAAAMPASIEDLAACGLPEGLLQRHGQQILDAVQGAPDLVSQVSQPLAFQKPGGQENRVSMQDQRSEASCGDVPGSGKAQKREGASTKPSPAPNSVAARFGAKKQRTGASL